MDCLETRLKEARLHANMTQPQLSDAIDLSLRTIKKYEKDASNIALRTVRNIALSCNVNEIWLLTGQGKMIEDDKKSTSTENSNITTVVIEHQNIIKQFKDPERGLKINQKLIEIQDVNEDVYDQVESFINGAHQAVKTMKKASKKKPNKNENKNDIQDRKSS
ncbi:MAG: helix-turn-helix domain-containing protein [Desulfobacula sp.]|nr:helix-turn-helix domain-containing protein [Desulfobacula sp.]